MNTWQRLCEWLADWIDRHPQRFGAWLIGLLALIALCVLVGCSAQAATHLAMVCTDTDAASKNSSTALCTTRIWSTLDAVDYAMSASSAQASPLWGSDDSKYRRFAGFVTGDKVLVCKRDLAAELPYATDPCKDAQAWVAPASIGFPAHLAHLSWLPSDGATSYIVKYGTTKGGPYTHTENLSASVTARDIKPPKSGTWYFVVHAKNSDGESTASAEVSKLIKPASLGQPIVFP